jgi:serine/threonine-protein kinase
MRFRRPSSASSNTPRPLPYFQTMSGRRLIRQAGLVAGSLFVGYLIAFFWLFPAPLFSSDHSVPRVLELGVTEARAKLEQQGFRFRIEDQVVDPTAAKNAVIWQDPPPGVVAPANSPVALTLSDGPPDVPVPDVAGFPNALAEKVLKAAGFRIGKVDTLPSANPAGTVVQSRPSPGVGRPAGTAVELVLSGGPAELSIPMVIGLPVADAREKLEEIGLIVGTVAGRPMADRAEGSVFEQRPAAGVRATRGTRVDLLVARKGP